MSHTDDYDLAHFAITCELTEAALLPGWAEVALGTLLPCGVDDNGVWAWDLSPEVLWLAACTAAIHGLATQGTSSFMRLSMRPASAQMA